MLWQSIVAAVLSGVLTALSFPNFNLFPLAWFSLTPLLIYIFNPNTRKLFLPGIVSGTVSFSIMLYWIVPTFSAAGEPWVLGIFSLFALAVYLSIYTGLFCLLTGVFYRKSGGSALTVLFAPSVWTSLEFLRGHLLSGFPWGLIGYSQWKFTTIIQISDLTGVYGVSFLLLTVNVFLAFAINKFTSGKNAKNFIKKTMLPALAVSVFLCFSFFYGIYSLNRMNRFNSPANTRPLRVSILQGNIDQYKKWDKAFSEEIISTYEKLALEASKNKPAVILWPESALPGLITADTPLKRRIAALCRKTKTNHIMGAVDFNGKDFFNSAFLLNSEGKIYGRYDKIHLVPFGENIPFKSFLGKYINTLNEMGEITPGKEYNLLSPGIPGSTGIDIGADICFEAIFPEISRKFVRRGAGMIVNLTNDAWYLDTAAPKQHFIFSIFRAIENRRYVLRAANTGISGIIAPSGIIQQETPVLKTTVLTAEISMSVKPQKSVYTNWGDAFPWACILISTVFFLTSTGVFHKIKQ